MPRMLDPFQFLLVAIAAWMNQRQLQVIDYLREENRVLREQLGEHRLRFNDDQRRRPRLGLAVAVWSGQRIGMY